MLLGAAETGGAGVADAGRRAVLVDGIDPRERAAAVGHDGEAAAAQGRPGKPPPATRGQRCYSPSATAAGRAFFRGLDIRTMPPLLGYNKTRRRPGGQVLLEVAETGDPLLAARRLGKGRVLAYTSDPAPHAGLNFVYWEGYGAFWRRCLDWVLGLS
ncbi:MAG TPA: glutamine amidotransferase [Vicinamibacteria bacterium]